MRVENPKEEALLLWLATPNFEGGFWLDVYILPWDSHLFKIMCNSVGAARCRKLWYRKRISLVVWPWNLCSRACTMPYLSSVVPAPRSTATMGHYLVKMYQEYGTWGIFFFEKSSDHPCIIHRAALSPQPLLSLSWWRFANSWKTVANWWNMFEPTNVPTLFGIPTSWQHDNHFSFSNSEPL